MNDDVASMCISTFNFEYGVIGSDSGLSQVVTIELKPNEGFIRFKNPVQVGSYSILVFSNMPSSQTIYSAEVQIVIHGNANAPDFVVAPVASINLAPGTTSEYDLPTISDSDGDSVTISLDTDLGGVTLSTDNLKVLFDISGLEPAVTHILKITLTDDNWYGPKSTVYEVDLTVGESLILSQAKDCLNEPFPKVWTCKDKYITPTIVETSASYILVIANAETACFTSGASNLQQSFFATLYSISTGAELWIASLSHQSYVVLDIDQVVIDEEQGYVYLEVVLLGGGIEFVQLNIDQGFAITALMIQQQEAIVGEYKKRMAIIDGRKLAVLCADSISSYLLVINFLQKSIDSHIEISLADNTQIEVNSLSYEPNNQDLFISFQGYQQKDSQFIALLKQGETLLVPWMVTTQPYDSITSISTLDTYFDMHTYMAISLQYFQSASFQNQIIVRMSEFINSLSLILTKGDMIVTINYEPKVLAIKIVNASAVVLAVKDTSTQLVKLMLFDLDQHVVEGYTLGDQVIASDHIMAISIKSMTQVTFIQQVNTFNLQNYLRTKSMTMTSNSFLLYTSENLINSCIDVTPSLSNQYDYDALDIGNYVDCTAQFNDDLPPINIFLDTAIIIDIYHKENTNFVKQSICLKRKYIINNNNNPQQTLSFKAKQVLTQSKAFNPFTVTDANCLSQVSFTYSIVPPLPGISLPSQLSIAENVIMMDYIENPQTFIVTVQGTIFDGTSEYASIKIVILNPNIGPPVFSQSLQYQQVVAGERLIYSLPSFADPDGDTVKVTVNLVQATSFATYLNGVFTFAPPVTISQMKAYIITITLTDQDSEPLSTSESFSVTILPSTVLSSSHNLLKNDTTKSNNTSSQNQTASQTHSGGGSSPQPGNNLAVIEESYEFNFEEKDGKKVNSVVQTNLTAKISSISNKGLATIVFSDQVLAAKNYQQLLSEALKVTFFSQSEGVFLLSWNYSGSMKANVTSYDRIKLQLNFSDPILVSQSNPLDDLQVSFIGNGLFRRAIDKRPIKYKYTITNSVPLQTVDSVAMKNLETVGGSASDIMSYMGYTLLIMQIFMSVSMSLLWGLMHTMQIIIHLKMLNVLMPINSQMVISFIEKLASFKIGKQIRNYLVQKVFQFLKEDDPNSEDEALGKDDPDEFNQNMKLLLFGLIIFIVLATIFVGAYLLRKKLPIFNKIRDKLQNKLFYNGILRSFYATYLKVSIATFNALTLVDLTSLDKDTLQQSAVTVIMLGCITIGYPIFAYKLLSLNKESLKDPEFIKSFTCLLQNLNLKDRQEAWMMPCLFLGRRLVYAFSIAFLGNATLLQITLQIASSIFMLYYLCNTMPYTDRLLNVVEILNECSLLVCAYFLFCFSDFVESAEFRYTIGWVFSGFILLNLSTNWTILFVRMLQPLYSKLAKFFRKRQRVKKEAVQKIELNMKQLQDEYQQQMRELEEHKQRLEELKQTKEDKTSFN
ncbi:hypothetical protein FGO68_gene8438 [Halteria grandinella]|uniref:TRP C-terminal domain-containing protein n=1 Tax=Halteria grandinella TaxID=5974 RepID=A0A8J8P9K2_HALGN|nr:hypothetical protein FGO68_gene8438 [Halteria grandinella]